jgi:hypothetical protein
MSADIPAAIARPVAESAEEVQEATNDWIEPALTALLTAAAVFLASLLAVAAGLA